HQPSRYPLYLPSSPLYPYTPTPTTPIYTLSLHDALPISEKRILPDHSWQEGLPPHIADCWSEGNLSTSRTTMTFFSSQSPQLRKDRKSTRLNSSHVAISYAVFCLKKKKTKTDGTNTRSIY